MPDADLTPEQIKVLEDLLRRYQSRHDAPPFSAVSKAAGLSVADGEHIGDDLEDLGLIEDVGERLASGRRHLVRLTGAGRRRIEQINREREDPASRRAACQRQLLVYADRNPTPSPWPWLHTFVNDPTSGLHGSPFRQDEAHRAALFLQGEELLEYTVTAGGDDGAFKITHAGIKCVMNFGGDVSAWERHRMTRGYGTTNTYNGPYIQGDAPAAQMAWQNQGDVTQNRNDGQQIAPGFQALAEAVADLIRTLPTLGLSREEQQDVQDVAEEVTGEIVQDQPNPSRLRRAAATLRGYLTPVAAGAVAGASDQARVEAGKLIEQLTSALT